MDPQAAFRSAACKLFELAGSGSLSSAEATKLFSDVGCPGAVVDVERPEVDKLSFVRAALAATLSGDATASLEDKTASIEVAAERLIAADPDAAWTAALGKVKTGQPRRCIAQSLRSHRCWRGHGPRVVAARRRRASFTRPFLPTRAFGKRNCPSHALNGLRRERRL